MLNIRQIPIINDASRKLADQVIKQMQPKGNLPFSLDHV
jgi:hypothetical protein